MKPFPGPLSDGPDRSINNHGKDKPTPRLAVRCLDPVGKVARILFVVAVVCILPEAASSAVAETARESLAQAQAKLQTPPAWFDSTSIQWDTNKPWKDARLEIRRLMGLDAEANRQAVKLTWLYDVEAMGRILAPFVNPHLCTGCGLCEYRCHTSVFKQQRLLERSAIVVAGVALQGMLPARPA